jgi:hypothetical protein
MGRTFGIETDVRVHMDDERQVRAANAGASPFSMRRLLGRSRLAAERLGAPGAS